MWSVFSQGGFGGYVWLRVKARFLWGFEGEACRFTVSRGIVRIVWVGYVGGGLVRVELVGRGGGGEIYVGGF